MAKSKRPNRFKHNARNMAYENGVRRCPCCNVQLVWKAYPTKVQKNLATVDHIVPKSIGGADHQDNLLIMCRMCNSNRGDQCFVEYLVKHGVSKYKAEELYKKAHIVTLQRILVLQFTHNNPCRKQTYDHNKRQVSRVKKVVKNYVDYFGDYLPEFELLERILQK